MEKGMLNKKDLKKLVAAVSKKGRFYGPVPRDEGTRLVELDPSCVPQLEYSNFVLPVKRLFFPQSELLCACGAAGMEEVPPPDEKVVIFGVRPCDALSLVFLDKVFLDREFVDPYYQKRRDNSVIISLACSDPLETCFCTSVGGSPTGTEGSDILACDAGNSLLFEAVTKKGKAFMKEHSKLFKEPKGKQTDVDEKMGTVNVSGITEKLKEKFEDSLWDEIAESCLGCGICTYSCPTCHCFGIYDEKTGAAGSRIRAQDACMFTAFTLEASGHNPRPTRGDRMRQRIMHKFCYTVDNFGDIFCVGCGRCIRKCPVNVDIRETIEEVIK